MSNMRTPMKKVMPISEISHSNQKKVLTNPSISLLLRLKSSNSPPFPLMLAIDLKEHRIDYAEKPKNAARLPKGNSFYFDKIVPHGVSNSDFFNDAMAEIDSSLCYRKSLLFIAYGNTSSGKTYSILGNEIEQGVLQNTVDYLFSKRKDLGLSLFFSATEIYNEKVTDLLTGASEKDSEEFQIKSNDDFHQYIVAIGKNRKIAETTQNKLSSRSHCLYKIAVIFPDGSRTEITLVDLAGAERSKTLFSDAKVPSQSLFSETCGINKSLLCLSRCFIAIREGQLIPYREAKLTRILFEHLATQPKVVLMVAFNPQHDNFEDNLRVLEFSALTKDLRPFAVPVQRNFTPNNKSMRMFDNEGNIAEDIHMKRLKATLMESRLEFVYLQVRRMNQSSQELLEIKKKAMHEWIVKTERAYEQMTEKESVLSAKSLSFFEAPLEEIEDKIREAYEFKETPIKRARSTSLRRRSEDDFEIINKTPTNKKGKSFPHSSSQQKQVTPRFTTEVQPEAETKNLSVIAEESRFSYKKCSTSKIEEEPIIEKEQLVTKDMKNRSMNKSSDLNMKESRVSNSKFSIMNRKFDEDLNINITPVSSTLKPQESYQKDKEELVPCEELKTEVEASVSEIDTQKPNSKPTKKQNFNHKKGKNQTRPIQSKATKKVAPKVEKATRSHSKPVKTNRTIKESVQEDITSDFLQMCARFHKK